MSEEPKRFVEPHAVDALADNLKETIRNACEGYNVLEVCRVLELIFYDMLVKTVIQNNVLKNKTYNHPNMVSRKPSCPKNPC